jgi:hypothetical protein
METPGWSPPPRLTLPVAALVAVACLIGASGAVAAGAPTVSPGAPTISAAPAGGSLPTEINILPSPGTLTHCIYGNPPGVSNNELPLANGTLGTNVYAAPNGTRGQVTMCYNATTGALNNSVDWKKVGGKGGWFSYPQVVYGVNAYGGSDTYTNQSAAWTLPQTVATTVNESLWVSANYTFYAPNATKVSGYDLSFDNFLSEGLPPTFEQGPFVEILVLLDHHIISHPAGWINYSTETLVNNTASVQPWYVGYWCHGNDNGSSPTLTFDFSLGGPATTTIGVTSGTVGVNFSALLVETEKLVPQASCWTGPPHGFSSFYLGQEVFGTEAGMKRHDRNVRYSWTVNSYCLHTHVTVPTYASVACSSAPTGGPRGSAAPRSPALSSGAAVELLARARGQ